MMEWMSPVAMEPWISFLVPQRLWWLLLVPVLAGLYLVLRLLGARSRRSSAGLGLVLPTTRAWPRHVAVVLALLTVAMVVVTAARPKQTVEVPRERATVVVVIDVSLSMDATDVAPNRLEAAQSAADDFVRSLPPAFNVSLVSFAQGANLEVPPTQNKDQVVDAINNLKLRPATAIGEGIYTALQAARLVPGTEAGTAPPARIVLLSDGTSRVGRPPNQAAAAAKAQGVPVYTIAYGTEEGVLVEPDGTRVPVPVDRNQLAQIARIGGGKAYKAATADQLREVYRDIGSSVGMQEVSQEVSSRWAGFALVCGLLAAVGAVSVAARWP